nr:hypothetical protein [uncultured Shewanella sp.]
MSLILEKIFPFILAITAAFVWWSFDCKFPSNSDSLLSATLTVAGIFVGFLATSKAILLSMSSPIIEHLKTSNYMNDLVSYIGQAIWFNLLLCTFCVMGFFLNNKYDFYGITWIGIAVLALSAFVRVTNIMLKIFKNA